MRRAVLLLALVLTSPALADELNLATTSAERPNLLLVRSGLDHGFVLDLGYRRVVAWGGHQVFLGGDFDLPWAHPDLGDYGVRASVAATILGGSGSGWKLLAGLSPTLRATRNAAGDEHALGVDARVTAGYYRGWWCAGELGVDWAATTYVAHDQTYRDTVYAGAKDGWYASPGGTVYAGINAGVSVGSVDLVLRVGMPRSLGLGPQSIPFYALAGVNVTMGR